MRSCSGKGELVWCDLKPIRRPPSDTTSSTTEILAWPGIVTGVRVDPVAIKDGEPSENYSVLHGFKYDVKLCGQLEPNEGSASEKYHHLGQVDLLPFNAIPYEELLIKATKDVQAIAKGHRAQFGKEAAEEVEQIANWRKTFGNKMPIGDTQLPERWEKVLVHYAHALKISDVSGHFSRSRVRVSISEPLAMLTTVCIGFFFNLRTSRIPGAKPMVTVIKIRSRSIPTVLSEPTTKVFGGVLRRSGRMRWSDSRSCEIAYRWDPCLRLRLERRLEVCF